MGGEGKTAEIDSGYFGGYVKPANLTEKRKDRRFAQNQSGKRRAVVIIRERNGNSLPAVFRTEGQALNFVRSRIAKGTVVNADESAAWNDLHARFEMKRINHEEAYSLRLHQLGRGIFQPHASRGDRLPPPYRRTLLASLRARGVLAGGSPPHVKRRSGPYGCRPRHEGAPVRRFLRILATAYCSLGRGLRINLGFLSPPNVFPSGGLQGLPHLNDRFILGLLLIFRYLLEIRVVLGTVHLRPLGKLRAQRARAVLVPYYFSRRA